MYARFVFYNAAGVTLVTTSTGDEDLASALHEMAEGIGLAIGFHGMPDPSSGPLAGGARIATDANIEAMMSAMNVDVTDLDNSTTGEFVESVVNLEAGAAAVEAEVATAFGLDATTVAGFRTETPG